MPTRSEQRKLLQMQAELARLKITAEHLKTRKAKEQDNFFENSLSTVVSLADAVPSGNMLFKTFFLPLSWKYRIITGMALAAWKFSRLTSKKR
ncbi:hypothetical protein LVJ85_08060 [Neisseria sp. Dent CA1/247]|uniref:YqjK-like protein n=1 Tax=Neisseria zoodegmatis TaxID=326523 RepID=A0A1X3CU33_9NEIS|nr:MULTISPECIES: hypothetical protein [Neisseria]MDO5070778.1 hypothetical protein [Neisseria zoodegmatis]OSI10901.1 hypothetical protein BWD10_03025 [Neisseria zoodegmatis]UOO76001.1 hypothetical protein LVJ85_08060 [Neisseria sp. Dent CA1/247]SNU80136.1 Uncharacterised protein [Neisseria zoodegmatis]SUA35812.1 Uncharacterised protein [Neisseria zoodegmatis]